MTASLFVYRALIVLSSVTILAIINFPPPNPVALQDLWVKTWVWIPITLLYSVAFPKAMWQVLGPTRRGLFFCGACIITSNVIFDYFIVGLLLQAEGTQHATWTGLVMGLLYIGSLIAGPVALIALITRAAQRRDAPSKIGDTH